MKSIFRTIIVDDEERQRNDIQAAVEFFFRNKRLTNYEYRFFSQKGDPVILLARENGDGFNESDIAFIDYNLGLESRTGLEIAEILKESNKNLNIVFVSAQADFIDIKRQDSKNVISYWVPKPISQEIISNCISSVIFKREAIDKESLLSTQVNLLVKHNMRDYQKLALQHNIVYHSDLMEKIISKIIIVAALKEDKDARVLITGANGTGKEGIARMIHNLSNRKNREFVAVNCAAIPSELIESQLFGHEKGSFTSASGQRKGDFERANEGTIFLDEIGDMSLTAQAKVLRVLEENIITRVGGTSDIGVNVKVITATNKNLHTEIKKNRFREDLFHRISVIPIHLPTLNQRGDNDIRLLAEYFVKKICSKRGININLPESSLQKLCTFNYSGNIRQLENIIEYSVTFSEDNITPETVEEAYVSSIGQNDGTASTIAPVTSVAETVIKQVYYPHQLEEIKKDLSEYENKYNELFASFLVKYELDRTLQEPTIREVSVALGHSYNYITERFTGTEKLKEERRDKAGFLLTSEFKIYKINSMAPFKKIIMEYKKKESYQY